MRTEFAVDLSTFQRDRVSSTRLQIGFDARETLTGDYDDLTVRKAVEGHTQ